MSHRQLHSGTRLSIHDLPDNSSTMGSMSCVSCLSCIFFTNLAHCI